MALATIAKGCAVMARASSSSPSSSISAVHHKNLPVEMLNVLAKQL